MTIFNQLIEALPDHEKKVFIKALSRNDHSWADDAKKHQAGFYIPSSVRKSGFFPELLQRPDKTHIFDVLISTVWVQDPEFKKDARIVHYSNKGPESHITNVSKSTFKNLSPSSLLVCLKRKAGTGTKASYTFFVIDSETNDYEEVFELFDLKPSFSYGIVEAEFSEDPIGKLIDNIVQAIESEGIDEFIVKSTLPSGEQMAQTSQNLYLDQHNLDNFNPFKDLREPGNAIAELIDIQYINFKEYELKLRSAQIIRALIKKHILLGTTKSIVGAVVSGFREIHELFKSLRGARASRVGKAFELHIKRVLEDGSVCFDYQPLIGKRTPDFILPSESFFSTAKRKKGDAFILTAKTTLKERWQQIANEGGKDDGIFLATIDRTINDSKFDDLEEAGVKVVVPERYKKKIDPITGAAGIYFGKTNAITFREFFDDPVKSKIDTWTNKSGS